MGIWVDRFYMVSVFEIGHEKMEQINTFAARVVDETYDRFAYGRERRIETIRIGKIAEEVFINFLHNEYGIDCKSNYEIYEGIDNVDEKDFSINNIDIDIKSSKDTKNEGIINCYNYFNFPVPTDQTVKDVTVSILYDYNVEDFYIVSWIDRETYMNNCTIGYLPVGGGVYKEFYKYKLNKGNLIEDLKDFLL